MKVQVFSQPDKITVRDLQGHVFSQQERFRRALMRLFAFLGLAVFSILVPVFHFVLVPLFALLAPFMGRKAYKEQVVLEACELPCPECLKQAAFPRNAGEWPLHANCPQCMNRVYFDKENA